MQDKLLNLMSDDSTEVKCAALYALGTFMGASGSKLETEGTKGVAVVTGAILASPMCRKELVVLVSCLVKEWQGYFVESKPAAKKAKKSKRKSEAGTSKSSTEKSDRVARIEHLNYKRMSIGMKIFSQIVSIQPLALVVSLPNQLFGHVPITNISSQSLYWRV
ncbi:hypothetical protein BT96DRAFT_1003781 [Gymnopus androsaceus JB14]|uniref:Uncharacterized protein n=1 Tax=Gymnopus androsaceus JB14 TaxID=1447944 RepID=A0A6A4GTY7_9AGAR|nr:hypothetical protein BT96DRAFT_1003781 [Gymnopus androsaceus JB14]